MNNKSVQENLLSLKEVFTVEAWDKWIIKSFSEENLDLKSIPDSVKEVTKEFDGLNVSYKVQSKETPKLLAGKLLKGNIFNDWHTNFLAKRAKQGLTIYSMKISSDQIQMTKIIQFSR